MRTGGLLVFDNMLRHGKILDAETPDAGTRALRELNVKLGKDPRVGDDAAIG